ncbi:hypothetical protein IP92_01561 [Pseudoduganella flava]|uniref:Iron transporter n=1 Tax=Pseudoduganella flava TaxID=871742 RepID=A0A562Q0W5_9BURK|nr:hypothetical protein [Pseudoduganella flava]QGZ38147.1 hypothetical protein GO485_03185 [Pseudoduganella flava]TWI50332.1 hypothetical protein IP92_01561 [Pseudoduganella flava]
MVRHAAIPVTLRVVGAVGGGYVVTASTVAALAAVLAACGVARPDAVVLASIGGFLLYLALLLWAFTVKSVTRLWFALAGGATLALSLTWSLAAILPH